MAERPKRRAVMLEDDLHRQAGILAAESRDRSVTSLVRRLIREEIQRAEEREKTEGKP